MIISAVLLSAGCNVIPSVAVWLKKVDFEVSSDANKGSSFVCHIVAVYASDLKDKIQGMDSQSYFSQVNSLLKTHKDSLEIFRYDLIPGKNKLNQAINLRSYSNAKAVYVFAKYTTPGNFMENLGMAHNVVIRFLPYKMEVHKDIGFDSLKKNLNG